MTLEEALEDSLAFYDGIEEAMPEAFQVLRAAARLLLDFPTDEMVRVGVVALRGEGRARHVDSADWVEVRDVLEAVRRVMLGEER